MNEYLQYLVDDFFYTIVDAIALAVSLGIFIKVITLFTPLKNWGKIQENNLSLTIILTSLLVIFGAFAIAGFFI